MQFINIFMLLGLAAIAIPIVIQIITRKNARRIEWGAWLFLDRTMQKRQRKVLLEDILLLVCRCLAIGLLALGFARPFVRPDSPVPWAVTLPLLLVAIIAIGVSFALWRYPKQRKWLLWGGAGLFALAIATIVFERQLNLRRFGLGATKDIVLIIDGSASMSIVHDGKSNFERAVEEARKYVETAPRNTSFSVMIGGPVPQVFNPVPIADRRVILNTLEKIRPSNGTMQIAGNLTAAAVTLAAGRNAVKQIVIVGDGQTVGWPLADKERWKTIDRVFSSLKTKPIVTWRTLPLPTSIRNLAISSVRPSRAIVGTDRDVTLDVTVVNAGTEAVTPRGVTLSVEGAMLGASGIRQLEPGETQTFSFRHRFRQAGGVILKATVDAGDDLPADDTYQYAMPVTDALKVLIVDGDSGSPTMSRPATYLKLALRPEFVKAGADAGGTASHDFLIDAQVEDVTVAASRRAFSGFAAVVLSGVRRLPDESLKSLAAFVRAGGGLFVMPSPATDAELFNAWTADGEAVLPAPLGNWRENRSELDAESFREPLARFRAQTDLGSVTPPGTMAFGENYASNAVVLARFKDESPFLLSRSFGNGTVMASSVRFDPVSGIVAKRGFLPFVHELFYSLAQPSTVELDVRPSEGLRLLIASGAACGEAASEPGLVGYYYPKANYQGRPIVRVDKSIDFNWGGEAPMKGMPNDNFSVVWRGVLTPKASGTYQFSFDVDDRVTLRLGERTIRNWEKVKLTGGEHYPVTARFEEDGGLARVRVRWRKPDDPNDRCIGDDVLRTRIAGVESAGYVVELVDPHGEPCFGEIFAADEGLFLRLTQSVIPGVYEVTETPDLFRAGLASVMTPEGKIRFSVSAGAEESTVEAITQQQLSDLCAYVEITQAIKEEDVIKAIGGEGFGKEVWRLLALFAFLFLVTEPAIARWIAINRRTGDIIDTEGSWIRM